MTSGNGQRYRFGDYELNTATRQLLHAGKSVTLEPRVYKLLAFLIEQRHRAVDKDEIQGAVWAPAIVSDTALTRAIMKARRALGDDAEKQSVIRTVHGHGYQFVAPIADEDTAPQPSAEEPAREPVAAGHPSRSNLRWLLAAAVAVLAIGIVFLLRTPTAPDGVRVAVLPIMNVTGDAALDWAKYGLMGLANEGFVDAAELNIVSAADVVGFVENNDWDGQLDEPQLADKLETLRRGYGATHVLVSQLEQNVGGLRLNYTLVGPEGRRHENTMVSDDAPALVEGMVRSVSSMLGGRRHIGANDIEIVDEDPFINEAYARGMSFSLEGRCAEALPLFEVVLARSDDTNRAKFEWASCARILGRWQDSETAYREMLSALEAETSSSLRADALGGLGVVYHRTGRLEEADATYRRGLDEALAANDRIAQGKILISMAILAKDRRDFAEARTLLGRATLAYRELEWDVLPGQIYSTLANIGMNDGKLTEAEEDLNKALDSFRAVGDRRNEAMMLNNYGFLRRLQGRHEDAEPLHLQSLAIRQDIGDRVGQGRIYGMLAVLYEHAERYADARDAATNAVAIARDANDSLFLATGLAQLGAAERGLGNLAAARAAFDESRDTFIGIEDFSRAAQVELRLAKLDIDEGGLTAADQRIHQVLDAALAADYPEPAIEAMDYAGDVALLRGNPSDARNYYEQALAHIEDTGFTSPKTGIAIKLAALYLDEDKAAAAEPLLGFLIEQEQTAEIYKLRARFAHMTGDHERSVTLMEAARDIAGAEWSTDDSAMLARYEKNL
ncbi:MAG: tetratricopeptide repeat protein [Gammaproteobacteria bacterium]|nr:tetratricopeptide repeat protein [Gammaproteobacteria bacterium]